MEGDKEDSKRCKAVAIKGSWVGAVPAREVGYAVRSAGPTCFARWNGAVVEFHMDTSPLADNNGRFASDTLHFQKYLLTSPRLIHYLLAFVAAVLKPILCVFLN